MKKVCKHMTIEVLHFPRGNDLAHCLHCGDKITLPSSGGIRTNEQPTGISILECFDTKETPRRPGTESES